MAEVGSRPVGPTTLICVTYRRMVDTTLLNDEVDLLLLRMHYLAPHVTTSTSRSRETYTGLPKPMHLTENLDLFEEFADRLTVIIYGAPDGSASSGSVEEMARESLRAAVAGLHPTRSSTSRISTSSPARSACSSRRQVRESVHGAGRHLLPTGEWRLEAGEPHTGREGDAGPTTLPPDFTKFRAEHAQTLSRTSTACAGGALQLSGLRARPAREEGSAAFSHSEFVFAKTEAQRLLTVSNTSCWTTSEGQRLPGNGLLTVVPEKELEIRCTAGSTHIGRTGSTRAVPVAPCGDASTPP